MSKLTFIIFRTFREDLEKLQKDNEEMAKQLAAQGSLNATLSKVIIVLIISTCICQEQPVL